MISLPALRAALGGDITGGQLLCPGPGHSPHDRSLAVRPSSSARLGFVVTSHADDDWRLCRDYVCERTGMGATGRYIPTERERIKQERDDSDRIAAADRIWRQARDPLGTIVERYLATRALPLGGDIAGTALRFHPACPFGPGEAHPAMVAAMIHVETGELRAIHRTALTRDGTKIGRKMLGPSAGCAVMLDAPRDGALTVGEGIESTLSARRMGHMPAWAMCSTGGIARLPVVPGVERLTICVENDENGASVRAAEACSRTWLAAGRTVATLKPPAGHNDLNDYLRALLTAPLTRC